MFTWIHKGWNFEDLWSYYIRKENNFRRNDANGQNYPRFRTIALWDPNWLCSMPEWKELLYLDCGNLQKSGEMSWNLWLDADQSFFGISRCKLVLVPVGTPGFGNEPCRRRGWTLLASTRKDKWYEMVGPFSLEESLLEFQHTGNYKLSKDNKNYEDLVLILRSIWQGIVRESPA